MEDKLFERLDKLNISETNLLLEEDIDLSLPLSTRKRIEQSVKKKTGCYSKNSMFKDKISNIFSGIFMKKKVALALSTVMILSLGGGTYVYAKTPMGYVSVDINPSIELGVNAFDKVVSAEAYNEDGEKVLEDTNLINSNINKAVSAVISNAISEGYIKEDGSSVIEITTATNKKNMATELQESLKETADKTLDDNNIEAEVEADNVALARRDEARELGITPGKLNLIQKLQELDPTTKAEDYKGSSVKDIMKRTKELMKNNEDTADTNTNINEDNDTNFNTNTDINTDTNSNIDENTNDAAIENNKQETLSSLSVDSKKQEVARPEKDNNSNGKQEKKSEPTISDEKENKNVGSQENKNFSKSEKSNNSNSQTNKGNGNNK